MQYLPVKLTLALSLLPFLTLPASAQVIPDSSLGSESSIVIPNQSVNGLPSSLISGGALRGKSLFHSFQEFNVGAGQGVYFTNPSGVANIITRVTGSNSSSILGTIGILGPANLFLLNPNGITFGPGARLDLNGSFLGTTANSITLSNGFFFSATTPQEVPPLLTINVPTALNFMGDSGAITVEGTGQTLSESKLAIPLPITGAGASTTGLRVKPGQDITLIGGKVNFDGGIITAPDGQIKIGSVDTGQVLIDSLSGGQKLSDIQLDNLSLLDVSGLGGGKILLLGKDIGLFNGSLALVQSVGLINGGSINVNASSSLSLIGNRSFTPSNAPDPAKIRSAIVAQNLIGVGTDINVSTPKLILQSGGSIINFSLASGSSGSISITAKDFVQILGGAPVNPLDSINLSTISTASTQAASSGNISIKTGDLLIKDGAAISLTTYGAGHGGDLNINASKSVVVSGFFPLAFSIPSNISSSAYGIGKAGNISILSPHLDVLNGASVSTSTVAAGPSGNITINAPDYVNVSGYITATNLGPQTIFPSLITSGGIQLPDLPQVFIDAFKIPKFPSGSGGNLEINTGRFTVDNKAQVTVTNQGFGSAGEIRINANSVKLTGSGGIAASTYNQNGGRIRIDATDTLAVLENSTISADAPKGLGGGVFVNTQGLFYPAGSITVKGENSQLNGTIQLNIPAEVNIIRASANPTPVLQSPEVSSVCASKKDTTSRFISTGSGGNPPNPNETISSDNGWQHNTLSTQNQEKAKLKKQTSVEDELLIPATGVEFSPDGKMMRFISDSSGDISSTSEAGCSEANLPKK